MDVLVSENLSSLKLVCISTRNHWNPRIKTPNLFKRGKEFKMGRLQPQEIDRLLNLVNSSSTVRALVEQTFSGFSQYERRRRLMDRCESEMFVCLKNIFASEKFDDIELVASFSHPSNLLQYEEKPHTCAARTPTAPAGKKCGDHPHFPPASAPECHTFF